MYDFDSDRLDKLELLRASNVNPYPHGLQTTHTTADVLSIIGDRDNETLSEDPTRVVLAGRLMFKNEMGRAGFARIQDRSGRIQLYVKKSVVGEEDFKSIWKKLDLGDHVFVEGGLMRTRTGEATVSVTRIVLASKCMSSLPDKWKGSLTLI